MVRSQLLSMEEAADEEDSSKIDAADNEEKTVDRTVIETVPAWRQLDLIDTVNNVMRYQFEIMQKQTELMGKLLAGPEGNAGGPY